MYILCLFVWCEKPVEDWRKKILEISIFSLSKNFQVFIATECRNAETSSQTRPNRHDHGSISPFWGKTWKYLERVKILIPSTLPCQRKKKKKKKSLPTELQQPLFLRVITRVLEMLVTVFLCQTYGNEGDVVIKAGALKTPSTGFYSAFLLNRTTLSSFLGKC